MRKADNNRYKITTILLSGAVLCAAMTFGNPIAAWAMPSTGTAAENQVNVRETAVDGEINATLDMDQEVGILEEAQGSDGNLWYRISCNKDGQEASGWVRADMINAAGDAPEEAPAEEMPAEEAPQEEAPVEEAQPENKTAPSSITFAVGDLTYAIVSEIPDTVEIPETFHQTPVTYNGQEVNAYQYGDSDIVLFYMKNVGNDEDKKFFVYDAERNAVIPYNNIGGIVLLNKPVEEKVSAFFTECCCDFPNGSLPAYQATQQNEYSNMNLPAEDFYYVYGGNAAGEKGWYCYDAPNASIQRCTTNMQYVKPEPEVETFTEPQKSDSSINKLDYILGAVAALFVVLFLVMTLQYRKLKKADEVVLDDPTDGESWLDKMEEVSLEDAFQQEIEAYKEVAQTSADESDQITESEEPEQEPEFFDEEATEEDGEWLDNELNFL